MAPSARLIAFALLGLVGLAGAASPPKNALAESEKIGEISTAVGFMSTTPVIADYLKNPKTVCTVWAPDNDAFVYSFEVMGANIGLVTQNETNTVALSNYTITPDVAIKADTIGNGSVTTRVGEPMYTMRYGKKLYVFSNPDFPVEVKKTNLKAGKCLVHTTAEVIPPPYMIPEAQGWWADYFKINPAAVELHKKKAPLQAAARLVKAAADRNLTGEVVDGVEPSEKSPAAPALAAKGGDVPVSAAAAPAGSSQPVPAGTAPTTTTSSAEGLRAAAGLVLGSAALMAML